MKHGTIDPMRYDTLECQQCASPLYAGDPAVVDHCLTFCDESCLRAYGLEVAIRSAFIYSDHNLSIGQSVYLRWDGYIGVWWRMVNPPGSATCYVVRGHRVYLREYAGADTFRETERIA